MRTRAIPERLRGVITTRCYTNPRWRCRVQIRHDCRRGIRRLNCLPGSLRFGAARTTVVTTGPNHSNNNNNYVSFASSTVSRVVSAKNQQQTLHTHVAKYFRIHVKLPITEFSVTSLQCRRYTRAPHVKWPGCKIHRPGSRPGSALPIAFLCFGNSVNRK